MNKNYLWLASAVSALHEQELPVFIISCVSIAYGLLHLCQHRLGSAHVSHTCPYVLRKPPLLWVSPAVSIAIVQSNLCHSHHRLCSVSPVSALPGSSTQWASPLSASPMFSRLKSPLQPSSPFISTLLTTVFSPSLADHNHLLQSRWLQPSSSVSLITTSFSVSLTTVFPSSLADHSHLLRCRWLRPL